VNAAMNILTSSRNFIVGGKSPPVLEKAKIAVNCLSVPANVGAQPRGFDCGVGRYSLSERYPEAV
jgi:hypothetical protein